MWDCLKNVSSPDLTSNIHEVICAIDNSPDKNMPVRKSNLSYSLVKEFCTLVRADLKSQMSPTSSREQNTNASIDADKFGDVDTCDTEISNKLVGFVEEHKITVGHQKDLDVVKMIEDELDHSEAGNVNQLNQTQVLHSSLPKYESIFLYAPHLV